jgi:cystathionine gamma-synthase
MPQSPSPALPQDAVIEPTPTVPDSSVRRRPVAGPSTLAVHAGEDHVKPGFAITDPIFAASTYTFPDTQAIVDFLEEGQTREEYGRYGNPGEKVVEEKLAALDAGEASVLFSSGMAAFVGLLMAHVDAGDEIIFFDECYHRSR